MYEGDVLYTFHFSFARRYVNDYMYITDMLSEFARAVVVRILVIYYSQDGKKASTKPGQQPSKSFDMHTWEK